MSPSTRPTTGAATTPRWIQTTATLGLFLSLIVILHRRRARSSKERPSPPGAGAFRSCVSVVLLGISVWIRLAAQRIPGLQADEGRGQAAPRRRSREAFGQWKNAKIALLALLGLTAGQAVVWYSGQFYALFFLQNVLKVDAAVGQYHDRHGRWSSAPCSSCSSAGCPTGSAASRSSWPAACWRSLTYFPLFKALTWAANPALAAAQQNVACDRHGRPGDCSFQFNPVGTAKFTTSCDIATSFLTKNSVPYDVVAGGAGNCGDGQDRRRNGRIRMTRSPPATRPRPRTRPSPRRVNIALQDGGYPLVRDPAKVADQKLDALVAANPKLALDAAAIRAGDEGDVPLDQADQGQADHGRGAPVRPR